MRGLFVTGTDTGAGKTVVAGAIVAALRGARRARRGLQAGRDRARRAGRAGLAARPRAARRRRGRVPRKPSRRTRFGPPVSPHLAAELAGVELDLDAMVVAASAAAAEADAGVLVVEGVGGLLVPLTRDRSVRDLAAALGFPLVVAARPGLGTINHTLLTLEAARAARPDGRRRRDDAVAGRAVR